MIDDGQMVYAFPPLMALLGMAGGVLGRFAISGLVSGIVMGLVRVLSKPFMILGLIGVLLYYPEAIQWIFMKIGEIQIKIFGLMLQAVLPSIFGDNISEIKSWADIFNGAVSAYPEGMTEIMAAAEMAGLMGMVTTCLVSGFTIRIYIRMARKIGVL